MQPNVIKSAITHPHVVNANFLKVVLNTPSLARTSKSTHEVILEHFSRAVNMNVSSTYAIATYSHCINIDIITCICLDKLEGIKSWQALIIKHLIKFIVGHYYLFWIYIGKFWTADLLYVFCKMLSLVGKGGFLDFIWLFRIRLAD